MTYPTIDGEGYLNIDTVENIPDIGKDGKVPVKVLLRPGASSSENKIAYGVLELTNATEVSKGGVRRLLLRTRVPVPNIETVSGCCDSETTKTQTEMVTCHSVVTLPSKVAKALLGTDGTAVAVANAAINTALAFHLHHIAKAMGFGGAAVIGADIAATSDVGPFGDTAYMANLSRLTGDVLGDAQLEFEHARTTGNLRRMFAQTGAELSDVAVHNANND